MLVIRVTFADGATEDREDASRANRAGDGIAESEDDAALLRDCRDNYSRTDVWVVRGGKWAPAKVESRAEQIQRERADAAEKRLADLRAWALKERGAVRDRGAAEAARGEDLAAAWCDGEAAALGELLQYIDGFPLREAVEWVVARIDGKEG